MNKPNSNKQESYQNLPEGKKITKNFCLEISFTFVDCIKIQLKIGHSTEPKRIVCKIRLEHTQTRIGIVKWLVINIIIGISIKLVNFMISLAWKLGNNAAAAELLQLSRQSRWKVTTLELCYGEVSISPHFNWLQQILFF